MGGTTGGVKGDGGPGGGVGGGGKGGGEGGGGEGGTQSCTPSRHETGHILTTASKSCWVYPAQVELPHRVLLQAVHE